MKRIKDKLKKLPTLSHKKKSSDSQIMSGQGAPTRIIKKFNKWHVAVLAVAFVGIGYVIINAFAFSCSTNVCVELPEQNSVKSEDFHVRTQVKYQLSGGKYHVKVWLDKGKPGEQLVDVRRKTTDLNNGTIHQFDFYFGNPSSGTNGEMVFNRNLLTPGSHTITAEQYNHEVPTAGSLVSTNTKTFTVSNVKNLATSTEPTKTFFASKLPLSGGASPRYAAEQPSSQNTLSSLKDNLAKLDPTPSAAAHTGTGMRHGDFDVLINVDGARFGLAGVTVTATHPTEACSHNGNVKTTNGDGVASFRQCGVSSNSGTGATYTVTVSNTPAGYSLNDVATKQIFVPWNSDGNQKKEIAFNYKTSAAAPPPSGGCAGPTQRHDYNARVPLMRFWSNLWGNHFYYTNSLDAGTLGFGFCFERYEGYLHHNQVPGTVPLSRYVHPGNGNHAYTINRNDALYASWGYNYEFAAGYVSPTQVAGTTPLYRFWNPSYHNNFYTTNYSEGANAGGYFFETVEGYVWTQPGTYYAYTPSNPPLVSLTGLTANSLTFDAFGLGMGASGFPDAKTIASMTVKVDGVQTDARSLSSSSYNTIFGATANLGNINDGKYHTVTLGVTATNGKTANLTFYTDPIQPYTNTSFLRLSTLSAAMPLDDIIGSASTTNLGRITISTWQSNSDTDNLYKEIPLRGVATKTDNAGVTKECSVQSGITAYQTTAGASQFTYTNCPVAQNNPTNNYAKVYWVYAEIPTGFHLDEKLAKVTRTSVETAANGSKWAKQRITLRKNTTRSITFAFVKDTVAVKQVAAPETLPESMFSRTDEDAMLVLVNQARTQAGKPPLIMNETLREVARRNSLDMAIHGVFSHTGYDCSELYQRVRRMMNLDNVEWALGENILWGETYLGSPPEAHKALMNSPGHRDNILNQNYTEIGIGSYYRAESLSSSNYDKSCNPKASEALLSRTTFYTQVFSKIQKY